MISHKHKCIFIHIPKTAGMSINTFFHKDVVFKKNIPDYERLFGWCPKRKIHMQHATSKQLLELELVKKEVWDEYFKFSFVRNPWDRAYSDFKWIQEFTGINGSFKDFVNKEGNFETILSDCSISHYLGDHLMPQGCFFEEEGHYKIDFVGRFENFNSDIEYVLKKLSIESRFNVFKNKSSRLKDYSLFYTNSNKKLIENNYAKDIKRFNYTFRDNRRGLYVWKKLV